MRPISLPPLVFLIACGLATAPAGSEGPCPTELVLVGDDEPGRPMHVNGRLRHGGEPADSVRLKIFQTDAKGYYRRGPDGQEMGRYEARLAGEVCTDEEGRYRLVSVVPEVYPGGGPPAHVHIYATVDGRTRSLTFEVLDVCERVDGVLVCTVDDEILSLGATNTPEPSSLARMTASASPAPSAPGWLPSRSAVDGSPGFGEDRSG